MFSLAVVVGVKRREESATVSHPTADPSSAPKKPRLVFTDLQRRTLQAIFKVRHNEISNNHNPKKDVNKNFK